MFGYTRLLNRWRRLRFFLGLRFQAMRTRSTIELNLAKTCRIGKGVRIVLQGKHNKITLGDRAHLGEGVLIKLNGGELYLGERCEIRDESVAHISGRLYLEHTAAFSIRCVIHCGKSIEIGKYAGFAEYVTVMDGEHVHNQTDDHWWYGDTESEVVAKPLRIGKGVYVGGKATIVMGADIGDFARIGANAVVTKKIEPHMLAVGVPAKPIKKLV